MLSKKLRGFTLIELLTVIAIIFILAGLVLSVSRYVTQKGKTSRATAEIAGMSSACESYKADNGVYPDDGTYTTTYQKNNTATLNAQADGVPNGTNPSGVTYSQASIVLYRALSGDMNNDGTVNTTDQGYTIITGSTQTPSGVNPTVYMTFKPTQLVTTGSTVTAIKDPWGYSYGYSTAYAGDIQLSGTATHGYNPTFDLWSTAGATSQGSNTFPQYQLTWITNW
ncbi:MAG: prepilin-type N-terminal cleavage/methylation domain-containing protein [Chthoniobacteraceae bacterium]